MAGYTVQFEQLFCMDATSQNVLKRIEELLLARQRTAEERKIKYKGQKTKILLGPAIIAGDLVKVEVVENITLWYQDVNYLRMQREQLFHRITLEKRTGKWLIKDDQYRMEPNVATIPRPIGLTGRNSEKRSNGINVFRGRRYDRAAAVKYAQKWWNDYNPNFRSFSVDCTNYVSQVLYGGGAQMTYTGKQNSGWWYLGTGGKNDKWSYSWAVAHSLRWYLASNKGNLQAEQVTYAHQLSPGDVICYDWDGDGVWQHNTVVVAKDDKDQPLVNAHTINSQNRYWDYRDSLSWNEKTKYIFWKII